MIPDKNCKDGNFCKEERKPTTFVTQNQRLAIMKVNRADEKAGAVDFLRLQL
jgi:hypothetical protein